jgi:hypothetical protein
VQQTYLVEAINIDEQRRVGSVYHLRAFRHSGRDSTRELQQNPREVALAIRVLVELWFFNGEYEVR